MSATAAQAVAERIAGGRPSRVRASVAAVAVGTAAAVLTYRLLRGGASTDEE
jgi:hypothetical protein